MMLINSFFSLLALIICNIQPAHILLPTYKFEELVSSEPIERKNFSSADQELFAKFEFLYANNFPLLSNYSAEQPPKIPKVLHFIWVGPKPFPRESINNLLAWKKYHPHWKMKFWTDSPERPCPIEGMEKHLISEIPFQKIGHLAKETKNYGEQSDILRYEILYQEGGVYADHDIDCFQSFDALNATYDFYCGMEAPHYIPELNAHIAPNNGLVGIKPHHPILKSTIDSVILKWDEIQRAYPGNDRDSDIARVMKRTFHSFSLGIQSSINTEGNVDIVLPSCFFFPARGFSKRTIEKLKSQHLVYASHQLAGSWHDCSSNIPNEWVTLANSLSHKLEKEKKNFDNKIRILLVVSSLNFGVFLILIYLFIKKSNQKLNFKNR